MENVKTLEMKERTNQLVKELMNHGYSQDAAADFVVKCLQIASIRLINGVIDGLGKVSEQQIEDLKKYDDR